MRDLIPVESDIKLNRTPPTEDWAKIRALVENNGKLENGTELLFDDIFNYLGVEKC